MQYNDVYPGRPPVRPPQVMISDHSGGGGLPLTISPVPGTVPFVSLIPGGTVGLTTIPCTTPASVLPPSPPPLLTTQLPHVFVTDHSEVPLLVETRTSPTPIAELQAPSSQVTHIDFLALSRGASVPNLFVSPSEPEPERLNQPDVKPKTTTSAIHRYSTSTAPRANPWLKKLIVFIICVLVLGLPLKIGVELWIAAYGENNPSSHDIV